MTYGLVRKCVWGISISALLFVFGQWVRDWNIRVSVLSLSQTEAVFTRHRIVEKIESFDSNFPVKGLTNFEWDRVCFFPPYVSPSQSQQRNAGLADWGSDEEHWRLVFFNGRTWRMLVRVYVSYQRYSGPEEMSCGGRSAILTIEPGEKITLRDPNRTEQKANVLSKDIREVHNRFAVRGLPVRANIIRAFESWTSDRWPTVLKIDLNAAQRANEFAGGSTEPPVHLAEWWQNQRKLGWVMWRSGEESYAYKWLGRLQNGAHILLTRSGGGGTGVFYNLGIFRVSEARGHDAGKAYRQIQLEKLDNWILGDRFSGNVELDVNLVRISGIQNRKTTGALTIDGSIYAR